MPRYRKKPVIIEAVQWQPGQHKPDGDLPWPPGLCECAQSGLPAAHVHTLEGALVATPGDFIITGIRGEHYPCRQDIFRDTYELADGGEVP